MAEFYPVAQLRGRYGIGKQAEINRRKHLGIKPEKIDGISYITEQELNTLDLLDQWLKDGNKMKDFDKSLAVESSGGLTRPDSVDFDQPDYQEATIIESEEDKQQPEWGPLIELLAEKMQPPRSPIQNWRELEEASEKGWLLTTSQVHELAGAKPHGSKWYRGAFVFTKAGKIGREAGWLVEKL
ncbi:MAG: hypothetical protein ABEI32_08725 [Halothece sp.]